MRGPALCSLIPLLAGCAHGGQNRAAGWLVVDAGPVRLRTDVPEARALEVASELRRIGDALAGSMLICAQEGEDRLAVTLLSPRDFQEIASRETAGEYRAWDFSWLPDYEGQIILPDDLGPETRQVFQHELAHHVFASCLPSAPAWLNEGLARLLETASLGPAGVTIGLPPYQFVKPSGAGRAGVARVAGVNVAILRLDQLPSVERLMTMPDEDLYARGAHASGAMEANYATAWGLVHLLELGASDLHARFARFLGGLRELDIDPHALFAREFAGVPVDARLRAYLGRGQFPLRLLRIHPPRPRGAPSLRRMSAGEVHLHRAWLWSGARGKPDRRRHMLEHLDAARSDPDPSTRAAAHLLAAIDRVLARDFAEAEREVQGGLRDAPMDPSLLQAQVELLIDRHADASAAAERLRRVARTPDQLCTLGLVALMTGRAGEARALAARGRAMKPGSWGCRNAEQAARGAPLD